MTTVARTAVNPVNVGVGRIVKIRLDISDVDCAFLNNPPREDDPVVFCFEEMPGGYYIDVYDHRLKVREAFRKGNKEDLAAVFTGSVPCVGGYRLKEQRQYIVLLDIGADLKIPDGGPEQKLILTCGGQFSRRTHRVMRNGGRDALHKATKICVVEPRPPKPAK